MSNATVKGMVKEKVKSYLSDDQLIDKNELFSLLQYAKKENICKIELDSIIEETKKELAFSKESFDTEELCREAVYKLSNGQSCDSGFEFYIAERAKDLELPKCSEEIIIKKIRQSIPTHSSYKRKSTKGIYYIGILVASVISISVLAYLYLPRNNSENVEHSKPQSEEIISETLVDRDKAPSYSFVYHRKSVDLENDSLISDLIYLPDPERSRYIGFLISLKNIVNQSWNSDTPIDRYITNAFLPYQQAQLSMSQFKFKTADYIKEEKLLTLIDRIAVASAKIPGNDVYSGQYLDKAQMINWNNPDKSALFLMNLYKQIMQDLRSGHIPKSEKSASEILEIVRMASIIPIVYYYQSMDMFVGSNAFTEYHPSQVLSKLIPEQYIEHIDVSNKIDPLTKYDGFLNNIIEMRSPDSEEVLEFKQWCDGVRDYEMLGLLSFLQSFVLHSDSWLTLLDLDYYFSTQKPTILETDYKPLIDKYYVLERLLNESEKILELIATDSSEFDFLRLSVEPVKIMHQHLLLLSRVVFFDFPLASDSLQTLLLLKKSKGFLNDDERAMVEVGQKFSSIAPILHRFSVSPSVFEMWQAIMKMQKKELSDNEYKEMVQRSKTQPAWLERPKFNY